MTAWAELADALTSAPDLPEAACRGRHELFDGYDASSGETIDDVDYRHSAAVALCRQCPELLPCRAYSLKVYSSPLPCVIAGRRPQYHVRKAAS